jgi:hypothetical protein
MNIKHYNRPFQIEANQWWRLLSMNDWKAFEQKYNDGFQASRADIARIYDIEILKNTP